MKLAHRVLDRTVAWFRDPAEIRAKNQNAFDFGLARLLRSKFFDVRAAAYQTALDRVITSPKLALEILTGNFSWEEKVAVTARLRKEMEFPGPFQVAGTLYLPPALTYETLPKFFALLARRPHDQIRDVNRLWYDALPLHEADFMSQAQEQVKGMSPENSVTDLNTILRSTPRISQHLIRFNYQAEGKAGAEDSVCFLSACVIDEFGFDYTFKLKEPKQLDTQLHPDYAASMAAARNDHGL